MSREADLVRSFVEMADTLVDDYDVVDLLTGLADRCVSLLGVSAAGVMLVSPAGRLGLAASSSEAMRLLDRVAGRRSPPPPSRPAFSQHSPCRCGCGT